MIDRRRFLAALVLPAALPGSAAASRTVALTEITQDPALPVLGNPDGDVTIAEFFDYGCPTCKLLHPDLKRLVEDDGSIRLVMKDWPINGNLVLYASRMVLAAARIGQYAVAHSAVMSIAEQLTHRSIDAAMRAAGLDVATIRDALDIHIADIDALLRRNERQARALGLAGTPAFVIGAKLYRRAMPVSEIREAVLAERQKAQAASPHRTG